MWCMVYGRSTLYAHVGWLLNLNQYLRHDLAGSLWVQGKPILISGHLSTVWWSSRRMQLVINPT